MHSKGMTAGRSKVSTETTQASAAVKTGGKLIAKTMAILPTTWKNAMTIFTLVPMPSSALHSLEASGARRALHQKHQGAQRFQEHLPLAVIEPERFCNVGCHLLGSVRCR